MRPFLAALLIVLAVPALAADWPHYRGPDYNGVSAEADFDATKMDVAWKADVGIGASSVVVVGDRVITMGNVKDTDVVTCFNREDGKVLWTYKYPAKFESRMFDGGTAATPTIADGHVYIMCYDGQIHCITLDKGRKVWTAHAIKDFRGRYGRWKYACSPLVIDGMVILDIGGDGNSTIALDAKTGRKVWGQGDWQAGYASVIPFDIAGRSGVIAMKAGDIVAHDRKTGRVLWTVPWSAQYEVNASSPVIVDNLLLVSNGYRPGKSGVFDLSSGKPRELWVNDRDMKTKMSTATVVDEVIYGVSSDTGGEVVALQLKTGKMLWAERGYGAGHLVAADGKLIVQGEDGKLSVLAASPAGEKVIESEKLFSKRNRSWVQPTIANGFIFAKNNKGELVALKLGG